MFFIISHSFPSSFSSKSFFVLLKSFSILTKIFLFSFRILICSISSKCNFSCSSISFFVTSRYFVARLFAIPIVVFQISLGPLFAHLSLRIVPFQDPPVSYSALFFSLHFFGLQIFLNTSFVFLEFSFVALFLPTNVFQKYFKNLLLLFSHQSSSFLKGCLSS